MKARTRKTLPVEGIVVVLVLAVAGFGYAKAHGHDNPAKRPTGGVKYSLHVEWRDLFAKDPLENGPAITYSSASGRPVHVPHLGVFTKAEAEWDNDVITTIPPYVYAGPYSQHWKDSPRYRISCTIWKWDIGGAYIVDGPHTKTTPGQGPRCQAKT